MATLGKVLLTLTDDLSTHTMGDDDDYNEVDDYEVDNDDDADLIEGQEGGKWTSSLRSIFHFMLCWV